ncbi:MAG: hypothetical protein QOD28_2396 [Acidobacteriota bacterium]|nr:hypothetical protein [Acidobacteriota bacterium]
MPNAQSTYIITRTDLSVAPQTISVDGLRIGRLAECEIKLNHPSVSRLHAGIRREGGRFYVTDLSPSNSTILNNRLIIFNQPEALADGSVLLIGPFTLYISERDDGLEIKVTLRAATDAVEVQARERTLATANEQAAPDAAAAAAAAAAVVSNADAPQEEVVNALRLFWDARSREKAAPPSPLHPHKPPPPGKARFNWRPTGDLQRPWPVSIFILTLLVGCPLLAAAYWRPTIYSPRPLSAPHAAMSFALTPSSLARQSSGNSCRSCHSLTARMESRCASCHQTEAFAATVTPPHRDNAVGCVACHAEHRGAEFRPRVAALETCAGCHRNGQVYEGRLMKTPHPQTGFGYPVVKGAWVWRGLDEEEWASKPEKVRAVLKQWVVTDERSRLVAQFHSLHVHRVRAANGLSANSEGEISCGSCHHSTRPLDRDTPRTTCGQCHNGKLDETTARVLLSADTPNCTSCHVQHIKDRKHWNPSLLIP